ncbi:hypothetical protein GZ78_25625 [Endozoicomonas numazuensis]|uniref:Uncharacterized protein n=1 Tax=Endozoicomonas numazuensis TaxID=1137799 RepID=A0A081N6F0_9GAMM|nr:hypothetical protein GZ78_25625 [Endozoicomonas numazuensis]
MHFDKLSANGMVFSAQLHCCRKIPSLTPQKTQREASSSHFQSSPLQLPLLTCLNPLPDPDHLTVISDALQDEFMKKFWLNSYQCCSSVIQINN